MLSPLPFYYHIYLSVRSTPYITTSIPHLYNYTENVISSTPHGRNHLQKLLESHIVFLIIKQFKIKENFSVDYIHCGRTPISIISKWNYGAYVHGYCACLTSYGACADFIIPI